MKIQRHFLLTCLCILASILLAEGSAFGLTLDFSSNAAANAKITFYGSTDTFAFTNTAGTHDFSITGWGSGASFQGDILGTFQIGTISTGGPKYQEATVNGTGQFIIYDGISNSLTGDLQWLSIYTLKGLGGSSGGLNNEGVVNITNIQYSGTNSDLNLLESYLTATAVLSFTFTPGKSLTDLTGGSSVNSTSYSGTVSAIPLPPTALLMGSGLLGLLIFVRRRKD